jgi:hypothetical protein
LPLVIQATSNLRLTGRPSGPIRWTDAEQEQLLTLLAYVFGVWTLENNSLYWNANALDERDSYLMTPHATQVLGILRMLSVGDVKPSFENNLVEIGTGEGKSITLAILSSILALLGANVSCACYSQYLSQRDYDAFLPLFRRLNVTEHIHYGTFNKVCEQWIERKLQGSKLRDKVADMIISKSAEQKEQASSSAAAAAPAGAGAAPAPGAASASPQKSGAVAPASPPSAPTAAQARRQQQRRGASAGAGDRVEILLIDEVDGQSGHAACTEEREKLPGMLRLQLTLRAMFSLAVQCS